jgi:hypothetical protein
LAKKTLVPVDLSAVPLGTAPLVVVSTTAVANLNADLLDGQHGSYYNSLTNATGTLAANKGGTGIAAYTAGNYIRALNSTTLEQRTSGQVLSDIGAEAAGSAAAALTAANTYTDDEITALGVIASGTWTPTLTNTTNIAASTTAECRYTRFGNVVSFAGRVSVTPTGAGQCVMGVSLPVASNFAAAGDAAGSGVATENPYIPVLVQGDQTNDRLLVAFYATSVAVRFVAFSGQYTVI